MGGQFTAITTEIPTSAPTFVPTEEEEEEEVNPIDPLPKNVDDSDNANADAPDSTDGDDTKNDDTNNNQGRSGFTYRIRVWRFGVPVWAIIVVVAGVGIV